MDIYIYIHMDTHTYNHTHMTTCGHTHIFVGSKVLSATSLGFPSSRPCRQNPLVEDRRVSSGRNAFQLRIVGLVCPTARPGRGPVQTKPAYKSKHCNLVQKPPPLHIVLV